MTHPTRAFSGSIINRFTGSKILARVGQISVAFPTVKLLNDILDIVDIVDAKSYRAFLATCANGLAPLLLDTPLGDFQFDGYDNPFLAHEKH